MKNEIVVEIRGATASGKSTLAQLFGEILSMVGIEAVHFDGQANPLHQTQRIRTLREAGLKVHIIEVQTNREAPERRLE